MRLWNQHIAGANLKSAREVVAWMGAMQAQDYAMSKWAIGSRWAEAVDKTIEAAISKGEILRTHLLRPTWHWVAAEDIYWLLELTAPRIKTSMTSRHRELELTEAVVKKGLRVIEKALSGQKHLTREDLLKEFAKAGLKMDGPRIAHLMLVAELAQLVCSGASKGKQQTYALLGERVPKARRLSREESLAELAARYFTSHGPASLQDFVWWAGLTATDAKKALEMVKNDFTSLTAEGETYWYKEAAAIPGSLKNTVFFLPAFDEFIISYKNRSILLAAEHHSKTISNNGIFRPVIVMDGVVEGIWSRTVKKDKVEIQIHFFQSARKNNKNQIQKAADRLGDFLEKKAEIVLI